MLTHDRSLGAPIRRTEEECWENFWRTIGEIAHRIWLDDHPASRSGGVLPPEGLIEDAF